MGNGHKNVGSCLLFNEKNAWISRTNSHSTLHMSTGYYGVFAGIPCREETL